MLVKARKRFIIISFKNVYISIVLFKENITEKQVMQNKVDNPKNARRIKISMNIAKEPTLEAIKQAHVQQKTRYMHGSIAAQRLGISSHLLSRITGTIYVVQTSNESLEVAKHNVGLNLKFNKKNEEVKNIVYIYIYI